MAAVGDPAGVYGEVYVYRRKDTDWVEDTVLTPLAPEVDDNFGHAVALSGFTMMVGCNP